MNDFLRRDPDPIETQEWLESLKAVVDTQGPKRAGYLLRVLRDWARTQNVPVPLSANTPYVNTIPVEDEPEYPGDREIERKLKSLMRWNAMALVVRANRRSPGIGGHISTYASSATLLEVGFHHFFRANRAEASGDQIYF